MDGEEEKGVTGMEERRVRGLREGQRAGTNDAAEGAGYRRRRSRRDLHGLQSQTDRALSLQSGNETELPQAVVAATQLPAAERENRTLGSSYCR